MTQIIGEAKGQEENEVFDKPLNVTAKLLVTKPQDEVSKKNLIAIKTGTLLDKMFIGNDDKEIDGIPAESSIIVVGTPNTGKSLLLSQLALSLSSLNHKVCFVTSEEVFRSDSARLDLETRMQERAKVMGLNWQQLKSNLVVLDCVAHAELREFTTFVSTLRYLVETEKVEIVLIDSLSLIDDSRNQLKFRLLELTRYAQKHGLTLVLVSQRATDDPDSLSVAGGLSILHVADIVAELDQKKASSWDSALKIDIPDVKQGQLVNFFRVQKCRLCKYRANYFKYEITKDGLVKLN